MTSINLWHPDSYSEKADGEWIGSRFSSHPSGDLPDGLLDIHHWYIEMGDSDTIEPFRPWIG